MDKNELYALIKETIKQTFNENQFINEECIDLDHLSDGISRGSGIGRPWSNLVQSLESVIDETKNFNSMYSPVLHGPSPNIDPALKKLNVIVKLLTEIKPIILQMDNIQRKDV